MTVAAPGLERAGLQAVLIRADPAAVLVPPRILRRVIKRARWLGGPGLQVPHRNSLVIGREALLGIAGRSELRLPADPELPATVLLLAEPDPGRLLVTPPGELLRRYWQLLFHARVHAELEQRRGAGKLTEQDLRLRAARIGRTELDAIAAVLRQENLLLPPGDLAEVYSEFAALYLELRHFEPHRLPLFFPLARVELIDAVLAEDVDAEALLSRTRLEGADCAAGNERADGCPPAARAEGPFGEGDAAAFDRLLAAAARSRRRGNLVRAALRSERAARFGSPARRSEARAAAAADLDRLAGRLRAALEFPPHEEHLWRAALGALLGPAAGGLWTTEGRLLYDLQKVCLDDEREVYAVDIVEWVVTGFGRPLRRHLPHQRAVLVLRHLRKAERRLAAARLPDSLRGSVHDLLRGAVRRAEEALRDRFRPGARAALDSVGLTGCSEAECVDRDKVVEELLDRVVERGLLTMSDLRDAVARNRVKLPDLAGPGEMLLGDRLIRANRALAVHLDGVYRRGEVYLRWLQRLSSAAFGTGVGRVLTRYLALPFGGAFMLLEGYKAVLHELPGHHARRIHDPTWLAGHLYNDLLPTAILGLFLLGMLHVPVFRGAVLGGLRAVWRAVRAVFVELPARVLRLPAVRFVLQSRAYLLLYLFVLKPFAWAVPVAASLYLADVGVRAAAIGGSAVFVLAAALLNSPLGSHVEELLADRVARAWQLLRHDVLPGLYYLVTGLFRGLTERVERLLYAVDEWLRFRTGDSPVSAAVKPVLGLGWFVLTYGIRAVINLFVEPTFNPIKHFPIVTVSAKLLVPFIPALAKSIPAAVDPLLGVWLGGAVAASAIFFIPGFAGFLVWELKENWRLYAANQPGTLRPQVVGSHGETVRRLLQPGFHSGTVPKLFVKLRHADGKAERTREERLHHVAESLRRFVERDLLAVLARSPRWGDSLRLRPGAVRLGTNRIRIELCCRDIAGPPLCLDIDWAGGRLLAGVEHPGWLPRLSERQSRTLADALAGFYHLAGVDLVREELEDKLPPCASYGVTDAGLAAWPPTGTGPEARYPLVSGTSAAPPGWPALNAEELLFSARPIRWTDWAAAWEAAPDGGAAPTLACFDLRSRCPGRGRELVQVLS